MVPPLGTFRRRCDDDGGVVCPRAPLLCVCAYVSPRTLITLPLTSVTYPGDSPASQVRKARNWNKKDYGLFVSVCTVPGARLCGYNEFSTKTLHTDEQICL